MKAKKNTRNNISIKSILIIISYFLLPYIVTFITKSSLVSTLIYLVYAVLLIFLYKDTFLSDFKDIGKNWKKYIKTIIVNVLLIFVSMIVINAILGILFDIKETSENDYSLLNSFKENPLVVVLLTCLYYPIVEGIIFRKSVRDIVDKKWIFIVFSSLFYFFFNIVYTSMSFNNILSSLCYLSTMMIVSNSYCKTNNFTLSVLIMSVFNLVVSLLSFI